MTRFLRLFPQFRALERAIDSWKAEESDWKDTESRLLETARLWHERCESAEARIRELTDKLLDDRAKVADSMAIRATGRRIFSKAEVSEMPQGPRQPMQLSGRRLAREVAAEGTREFFESLQRELKQQPETPVA